MTEEQATKLVEIMEDYLKAEKVSTIIVGIMILCLIGLAIYEVLRMEKMKKLHNEYLRTLTDEQLKALKEDKKYRL